MLTTLYVLQFIVSISLILVVMFQKTEGGTGLVSSNQYNSFFSNKALVSNPLTRVTVVLGFVFFLNSIAIGAIMIGQSKNQDSIINEINVLEQNNQITSDEVPLAK